MWDGEEEEEEEACENQSCRTITQINPIVIGQKEKKKTMESDHRCLTKERKPLRIRLRNGQSVFGTVKQCPSNVISIPCD